MRRISFNDLGKACSVVILGTLFFYPAGAQQPAQETWRFDTTSSLGGHPTKILGHPQVIDTPLGKAVQFNGVDDALFVNVHPLAGTTTWTWEMIFHPDADGKPEQRIVHLQSIDPVSGEDIPNERMLFEVRIRNGRWCLDSFATAGGQARTLLNCEKTYAFGPWYLVTAVYDGKNFRNYVGDELQGEGELHIPAERPGHSSVGVRINLRDYYKGAIYELRFTPRALKPSEFLELPQAR
jgi:hypothetical protein